VIRFPRRWVVPRIRAHPTAAGGARRASRARARGRRNGSPRTDPTDRARRVFHRREPCRTRRRSGLESRRRFGLGTVDELLRGGHRRDSISCTPRSTPPSGGAAAPVRGSATTEPRARRDDRGARPPRRRQPDHRGRGPTPARPESFPSGQAAPFEDHVFGGPRARTGRSRRGASYKGRPTCCFVGASLSHQNTFPEAAVRAATWRSRAVRGRAVRPPGGADAARGCGASTCDPPAVSTSNLRFNVGVMVQVLHDVWPRRRVPHAAPGFETRAHRQDHHRFARPRDTSPPTPAA